MAVLTVSDTRTPATDTSGRVIRHRLEQAGHEVVDCDLLPDDPVRVGERLAGWIADPRCRAVVITGGTGISRRDRTYEAVAGLLERRLEGFGELFRMLSWEQVGSAAMLSRALAGIAGETVLFSLPGSKKAVELALDRLILPELAHLVGELEK